MSLIGALTPLGKVARNGRTWVSAVALYTLAGLVTSAGVGAGIGELGRLLGLGRAPAVVLAAGLAAALALAARELGVLRFPLPERRLQTEKVWMHRFGALGAATLWGLHLGPGLFTRVNYGGFWLVVLLALGVADPRYGALLAGAHWLGRALPVWVAPLVLHDPGDEEEMIAVWGAESARARHLQAAGLAAAAVALGAWLAVLAGGV